jgi:DNA modification methylase
MYESKIEDFLDSEVGRALRGEVQLLFTSPPFPLNRAKKYGNRVGNEYLAWLGSLAEPLGDLLTEDGSFVVELGNAWESGEPVMSTLALEALMCLLKDGGFHLCQQFIVHNPARLPSPAQWVNVERNRVKDSYTNVWWMSRTPRPKADNRKVLVEYSPAMKRLIDRQSYNPGRRPSEHNIGQTSFLQDNGGAIPSNVLTIANTVSTDAYRRYVKEAGLKVHPARMPPDLAEFFVRFLTDEQDLVFDPFGGSNTTGGVAESLNRQWIATEPEAEYIAGSRGRFQGVQVRDGRGRDVSPQAIVRYLERQPEPVPRGQIAAALGAEASNQQWSRILGQLVAEGEIQAEGVTRGRRYSVAERSKP